MVETPRTPRTPGRPPPIAFDREESSAIHTTGGALYVWGRNSEGQCGEGVPDSRPAQCVALPHPVRGLPAPVRHVSCGTGQQGCTLAACVDGSLWSFGNDHGGRLGHGEAYGGACQRQPRRVEALRGERIVATACSDRHALGLTADGLVFSWGFNARGCLGRDESHARSLPAAVPLPAGRGGAVLVDCETGYSAAVLDDGSLWTWGGGDYGRLGLGDKQARPAPTLVTLPAGVGRVTHISLGSLYMAACCEYEAPPPPSPDPIPEAYPVAAPAAAPLAGNVEAAAPAVAAADDAAAMAAAAAAAEAKAAAAARRRRRLRRRPRHPAEYC